MCCFLFLIYLQYKYIKLFTRAGFMQNFFWSGGVYSGLPWEWNFNSHPIPTETHRKSHRCSHVGIPIALINPGNTWGQRYK